MEWIIEGEYTKRNQKEYTFAEKKLFGIGSCRHPEVACSCGRGIGYARLEENIEEDIPVDSPGETSRKLPFINYFEVQHDIDVEQNHCASDVCEILADLSTVDLNMHLSIVQCWEDLGLETLIEDHELVIPALDDLLTFSPLAEWKLRLRKEFWKFQFLFTPTEYFYPEMLDNGTKLLNQKQLEKMVIDEGKNPDVFSQVWIRDDRRRAWTKTFMLLKNQYLFIASKLPSLRKFSRASESDRKKIIEGTSKKYDVEVFANVLHYVAYTSANAGLKLHAPHSYGVALVPSTRALRALGVASPPPSTTRQRAAGDQSGLRCFACEKPEMRNCWLAAMRLAKYGKQIRESYKAFKSKHMDGPKPKPAIPDEEATRVAMDFTGPGPGRIVEDPTEAALIAAGSASGDPPRGSRVRARPSAEALGQSRARVGDVALLLHTTQPWFHAGLARDAAAELIVEHGSVDGVYLVRDSRSQSGCFVITYKFNNKVFHTPVHPMMDQVRDMVVLSIDNGATRFYDLMDLVHFYELNKGSLNTRLTHYVTHMYTASADRKRAFCEASSSAQTS